MATAVFTSLQQLLDNDGEPLSGGTVTVYQDGTTTLISLFSDELLAVSASNPITLDSAGRHGMRYFTAESYKVVIKNSSGTTLVTLDDIDTGVPLGTGVLAIANGGTGASIAATALSNLGGATAAELADLAADVAALSGQLASSEKTHIATGTTAQRPATPADGDIRRNTTTNLYEGYDGNTAAWVAFATTVDATDTTATLTQEGLIELATSAEVVTGTDAVRAITPATQNFSAGEAKAWAKVAANGTIAASLNVTSVVQNSTGDWTVTIANDFSSADYAVVLTVMDADVAGAGGFFVVVRTQAAGSFTIKIVTAAGADVDPDNIYFACYGTLA